MSLATRISALATAIRDKINAMMPRLLPAGGSSGQALVKTSAANFATGWATLSGGGGGALERVEQVLEADVALAANNTWYSGPAITLGPGTWLVLASGHFHRGATTAANITMRIWDGAATVASAGAYHASVNGINLQLATQAIVELTEETTMTLAMASTSGNAAATMRAATVNNPQGQTATRISAIKLG